MSESKEKTIKPLAGVKLKENRILIKDFEQVTTKGSIILPEDQWFTPEGGLVVSVGPGKIDPVTGKFVGTSCKVGDKVYYMQHGTRVEIDGGQYVLLRDTDVWGDIVEK